MDSDNDDKIAKSGEKIFGDSLLSVGELGLTWSDAYCDLSSGSVPEFTEGGSWMTETKSKEKAFGLRSSVQVG